MPAEHSQSRDAPTRTLVSLNCSTAPVQAPKSKNKSRFQCKQHEFQLEKRKWTEKTDNPPTYTHTHKGTKQSEEFTAKHKQEICGGYTTTI